MYPDSRISNREVHLRSNDKQFTTPGRRPRPVHGGTTVSENHEVYPTFICLQVLVPFRESMEGAFWEIESIVRTVRPISTSKWVRVVINKIPHQLLALIKCLSAVDFLPRDPHAIPAVVRDDGVTDGTAEYRGRVLFLLLPLLSPPLPLPLHPFFFFHISLENPFVLSVCYKQCCNL